MCFVTHFLTLKFLETLGRRRKILKMTHAHPNLVRVSFFFLHLLFRPKTYSPSFYGTT